MDDEIDKFVIEVHSTANWLARKIALTMMIVGVIFILYWLANI